MAENRAVFSIQKMARLFKVSKSGFYDWLAREASKRAKENETIYQDIVELFVASRRSYGARRIAKQLSALVWKAHQSKTCKPAYE